MDITKLLKDKSVEYVATNGHILVIRCTDGTELRVAWVDDNGIAVDGTPVLRFAGKHIIARNGHEIVRFRS